MHLNTRITAVLMAFLFLPNAVRAATWFVKEGATGSGTSWANNEASGDLALIMAGASAGDHVWVAQGTYRPGVYPWDSFALKDGVEVLGGFFGTPGQEQNPNDRTTDPSVTILSGDLGANESSSIIVTVSPVVVLPATTLEAFTLTGASQHAVTVANLSEAQFLNLLIEGNSVNGDGAGIFIDGGAKPKIRDCDFVANTTTSAGGGIVLVWLRNRSRHRRLRLRR